ncbi:MAG: hypothetical protein AVDCRST_MAG75-1021 [uncultured Propionibacteriaceae bacterium]|uniref:Cell division protein FtsL n=1 Tax=uncultured Propionibacteriaceae bacterium TaxID=257457 RepID=A0A6J4NDM5_9ACTN|nr:MAG: hypothetical protein AVDCRST_MAG75-1021 [uncultured Propionibacteriaceae bacterium]
MSALWAPTTENAQVPEYGTPPARTSTRLRAVPTPRARLARFPFLVILVGVFGLGMVGLLLLNTTLQNQAFESRALTRQAAELAYAQGEMESRIDQLAAPQELARRASQLGMRANPEPAFLVAPSGKLVGDGKPVAGSEMPSLIVKTPQQLAAERAAAEARKEARAAAAKAKAEEAQRKAAEKAAEVKKQAEAKRQAEAKKQAEREKSDSDRKRGGQQTTTTSGDQEGRG